MVANVQKKSSNIFTGKKNPSISEPVPFKPMLFNGQLYFIVRKSWS